MSRKLLLSPITLMSGRYAGENSRLNTIRMETESEIQSNLMRKTGEM